MPTLYDRASQALAKLALEPEWEAKFEGNSYGFRPGRGCHDAIEAIFVEISQKAKYVLDADIKGCFDHIDQTVLLDKLATYPVMRRAIRAWLKAGILEGQEFSPSEEGTPQGGVLSPLLANTALHGREAALQKAYTVREGKPALIRYADDFVVLHPSLKGVEKARNLGEEWLKGIGLELSPQKTRITHTLTRHEGHVGFDFLGQTVRQYPVGKTHSGKSSKGQLLGFKTLVTPSKEAIKRHVKELAAMVHQDSAAPQEALIGHLNPIVTGWTNYHRTVAAKQAFKHCDNLLYGLLRRWARRRHPNKTPKWVSRKYWALNQGAGWTFRAPDGSGLKRHTAPPIKRHVKVKGAASPYDGNLL
jgi:RNA-directed DNA polymerase